jgi:bifunctional non-homologous end joining protein LigD
MLRERALPHPAAFIEPCLPRPAKQPPEGRGWIHEIKHDGFRIMARRADGRVQLLTRKGTNFANRFPQIVAAVTVLRVRSCLLDGEAVVCDESGLAVFDLIRGYRHDAAAVLCAFDQKLLSHPHEGIAFNEHCTGDGAIIFKHACALGCEGIVSKRLGSPYRSGRTDHWEKVKNPEAPAVAREADEDWGREFSRCST